MSGGGERERENEREEGQTKEHRINQWSGCGCDVSDNERCGCGVSDDEDDGEAM